MAMSVTKMATPGIVKNVLVARRSARGQIASGRP
jgi:hypothetical protein